MYDINLVTRIYFNKKFILINLKKYFNLIDISIKINEILQEIKIKINEFYFILSRTNVYFSN